MSWYVIHWNVASWRQSRAMFDTSPHQRRPMWLSVSSRSQGNDVIAFSPLYNCCCLFTPEPVMNSRGGRTDDRHWPIWGYPPMHPYLHCNTVIPSSCTGCCFLKKKEKKKGSSSTCQLIDGVEGASPGCRAPPSKRHFRSDVCLANFNLPLPPPHPPSPRPWFSEHSSSAACVSDC